MPLQELLLGEPRVVEYLGRNLVARPSLLGAPASPPRALPDSLSACLCSAPAPTHAIRAHPGLLEPQRRREAAAPGAPAKAQGWTPVPAP